VFRPAPNTQWAVAPDGIEAKVRAAQGHKVRLSGTLDGGTFRAARFLDMGPPRCTSNPWVGTGTVTCDARALALACTPERPSRLNEGAIETRPAETVHSVEAPHTPHDWPRDVDAAARALALAIDAEATAVSDVVVAK